MRLLNQGGTTLRLDAIGMPRALLERFRAIVAAPERPGAGHRADRQRQDDHAVRALSELNSVEKKLITVEDPVEYRLPGINQVQVNEKIELTFARVLRSALRQDPGHRAGRRDARPGNRADRPARRHDRSPGAVDPAHQRRRQHAAAPDGHGRAALHGGQLAASRAGAAPGARDLRELHARRTSPRRTKYEWLRLELGDTVDAAQLSSTARAARTATASATAAAPASTNCWK